MHKPKMVAQITCKIKYCPVPVLGYVNNEKFPHVGVFSPLNTEANNYTHYVMFLFIHFFIQSTNIY